MPGYGNGEGYGVESWGSTGEVAPTLVYTSPADGLGGFPPNVPVAFEVTCPVGIDLSALNVWFGGTPVIVEGVFQPDYGGSYSFTPETLEVTINVHPDFPSGLPLTVDVNTLSNEGLPGIFQWTFTVGVVDGNTIIIYFDEEIRIDNVHVVADYWVTPLGQTAYPSEVGETEPMYTVKQTGSVGTVLDGSSEDFGSPVVQLDGTFVQADHLGDYLHIENVRDVIGWVRIEEVLAPDIIRLERKFPAALIANTNFTWTHTSAVEAIRITHTKTTGQQLYSIHGFNFRTKILDLPFEFTQEFVGAISKPTLTGVDFDDGEVLLTFSDPMRPNEALTDIGEYSITGPTNVRILRAMHTTANQVLLETSGFGDGSYTVEVNATGTPLDAAGNPIDPTFNTAIFTGATPLIHRSVFTDKGPLTKPPETIQSGTNASFLDFDAVNLPGGTLTPDHVGLYLSLTGSGHSDGDFRILSVMTSTTVKVKASFTLPDTGVIAWVVYDPRDGLIADDPADVTVRINGAPVIPDAVVGLLGQVVLNAVPDPADDVDIDYHWMCNPKVEIRRLNSKEFRLNNWNRDQGGPSDTQHRYRYNNVLIRPSDYNPLDTRPTQDQPLAREEHYRAYERAYTAALNDPNLLLLNSPTHKIAYPRLARPLQEEFIRYEALYLPENQPEWPWDRHGLGTASVFSGALTIQDDSSGPYPTGQPLYWTREVDLTFSHAFAASWRGTLDLVTEPNGVFTGVAAGYSNAERALVIGYLLDGGVPKLGVLKQGFVDIAEVDAWVGGIDGNGDPTVLPADLDWSILRSYRIFRDRDGTVRVYVDGSIVEFLHVQESDLPFLHEVNDPFGELQGVFFGSLSRPARNQSTWDFFRYIILPTNPQESVPSIFVKYEANYVPEEAATPWTPVGSHGTETILATDFLILDSTSGSDASVGLIEGNFKGFVRAEPLLLASSDVVLDVALSFRSWTHGFDPHAVMAAVDDGTLLTQLSFLSDRKAPLISYGGRSFPTDFTPYAWTDLGTQPASMVGRLLRIDDASTVDGLIYHIEDNAPANDDARVVSHLYDYVLEFRCRVDSYIPDAGGFAGTMAQVYDSIRSVGIMLTEVAGTRYVDLMSDGTSVVTFPFEWLDDAPHTYRIRKDTAGDLVSLFVDAVFVGSVAYSLFSSPGLDPVGDVRFGSSTSISMGAVSSVDWNYCNAWRILPDVKKYVGLWRGADGDSLIGYHLPLKASGRNARIVSMGLEDTQAMFLTDNVVAGDPLVVNDGPNKGVYEIAAVTGEQTLTVLTAFPLSPSEVDYRIPAETDWSVQNRYRIVRDPGGGIGIYLNTDPDPLILTGYNQIDLPPSTAGIIRSMVAGLPAVAFGAFSASELSQTSWDFVRYGVTRSVTELRIAPHHQTLNQWNVVASPEHLRTTIPHDHTGYMSCSTGIPPKKAPDFLEDPDLIAYTVLNEGTPLVPLTQTYEVRNPQPTFVPISQINAIEDLLNNDGDFTLNDATQRIEIIVPDDVLYNCLDVIEQTTGEEDLLSPICDSCSPDIGGFNYQHNVCFTYDGSVLPQNDTTAPTPWELESDDPTHVNASAFSGVLTYGTDTVGTRTVYKNNTPLLDAISLQSEVTFRIRVLQDTTLGFGDSQIRFGTSSPGVTLGVAFITDAITGERFVKVLDLNNGNILGSVTFDFLDGAYHTYRIVRDVKTASMKVLID